MLEPDNGYAGLAQHGNTILLSSTEAFSGYSGARRTWVSDRTRTKAFPDAF